jgi:glycerol kinase
MLMQFQADVLNTETVRPRNVETTVMGAAFMAGLAVGFWDSLEEIGRIWETDRRFEPSADRATVEEGIRGWYRAIESLEHWSRQ